MDKKFTPFLKPNEVLLDEQIDEFLLQKEKYWIKKFSNGTSSYEFPPLRQ